MQKRLDRRDLKSQPDEFVPETVSREGNDFEYIGMDLDGDKKPDKIIQSCGSPGYGSCTLYVTFSSGGGLEFSEEFFFAIYIDHKYYILVGESLSESRLTNRGKRRLYSLAKSGVKLICRGI
jgi:hypothetical protein